MSARSLATNGESRLPERLRPPLSFGIVVGDEREKRSQHFGFIYGLVVFVSTFVFEKVGVKLELLKGSNSSRIIQFLSYLALHLPDQQLLSRCLHQN